MRAVGRLGAVVQGPRRYGERAECGQGEWSFRRFACIQHPQQIYLALLSTVNMMFQLRSSSHLYGVSRACGLARRSGIIDNAGSSSSLERFET